MDTEKWMPVEGYGDKYEVSNLGRIKNHYKRRPKILLIHYNTSGYPYVNLYYNKVHKAEMIHRLVAKAFVPNPKGYNIVMHLDDNKTNNDADNLKWGTQKENLSAEHFKEEQRKYAKKRVGRKNSFYGKHHTEEARKKISEYALRRDKSKHPNNKKIICEEKIFYNIKEASNYYGINYSTLCCWLNGTNLMPKEWKKKGLSYYGK